MIDKPTDLVLYDARLDEKLRDMIDRDGKLLFCSVGGRSMMTVERIRLKKENYHRVYSSTSSPRKRS